MINNMDTSSNDIATTNNSFNRDIDILTTVLESGNCVELPADGYSMFPTLMPGNRVIVRSLPEGTLPVEGNVVVFNDNGVLVMHRLLEKIYRENGYLQFITRGDSRMEPDKAWTLQQFLGVAVRYKGASRERQVRTFIPRAWRYKYNRRLLWLYSAIKRVTGN